MDTKFTATVVATAVFSDSFTTATASGALSMIKLEAEEYLTEALGWLADGPGGGLMLSVQVTEPVAETVPV